MASDDTTPAPNDGPSDTDDSENTRIIRRAPLNTGSQPLSAAADPHTTIIRRHPTGSLPVAPEPATGYLPRATPVAVGPARPPRVDAKPAIATAVASIVSGWATGVIATDLITGWWGTDLLFCVAMGFLTAVAAGASISGVIALLLRRRTARLLIVVGAVISLLIFASLFVAGAKLPALVFAMPVLPLASIALAALPATARWSRSG
ncbi:hypothetical protein Mycch_4267 [Mycolicibacterium chubuense NBB4]|uniref:Uncharacterized protein n=1 Tax=Mycolicibacterium chubuense (strain NBB4) TaxID=710421 RepID=I4BNX4_MYCCN|nr:hypothetical protein [Mycolicibacterium chubuense]AFM18981.1 hypothetical protein Mycch_4267 [Mycolicibacterium chubuense NBB4]